MSGITRYGVSASQYARHEALAPMLVLRQLLTVGRPAIRPGPTTKCLDLQD